ncbi:MAG TPA: ABC transporter permease [Gordonia sp. (in: high G+C Gram-positive bacteria)]|uniref:ABC transporter permease n=1 Tax=unclassified Gordonia (in: high G+C Gram-positive bacteria) TaxID=2657482 RepID=UPI000FA878D2|nr:MULTISPECIES: ABC transporter permease [unclassified Gordonia (in: high G+C Gram-positive bacteria)]RUP39508.1 MAG: multidrug ABC transporter permease [Gordonia sp. (in: high G+C Gram-positive bacteria)]HNP57583.1 ABC transporter permease [Gordonia sp. (in: high G+C Gram-positive bacteria)]HRC49582.1 ABC transporter permease [Gordonia sp. (in: high G+C Gram-positive bacteria)]
MTTVVDSPAPQTAARPSAVTDTLLLAKRSIVLMSRRPISIIGAVVMPVMFATLFFTIFGRVMERAGMDFAQYLLPAIIMQAVFFSAMSGSVWAAEDASSGMSSRLRAMPIARSAPVIALLAGETVRGLFGSAILIAIGYAVGFRLETGVFGALALIGIIVVASVAIVLPYLVLGYALADPEATQAIGGVIYFPLLLVSTLFVPKRAYPGWLQPIVQNQPLSRVTEAMRAVSTDAATVATNAGQPVNTTHAVLIALAWCAGSVVIFGALAPRVFGRTA